MGQENKITADCARSFLRYEPETGMLFWRERLPEHFATEGRTAEHSCANWNARWAGKEAFTPIGGPGYRQGSILGIKTYAHRVIVLMVTGMWPDACIDHVNGNKLDNRWGNLRAASRTENNRNTKGRFARKGPHKGVRPTRSGTWRARIVVDKMEISLGTYACATAAALAYDRAALKHYGCFAVTNFGGRDARPV